MLFEAEINLESEMDLWLSNFRKRDFHFSQSNIKHFRCDDEQQMTQRHDATLDNRNTITGFVFDIRYLCEIKIQFDIMREDWRNVFYGYKCRFGIFENMHAQRAHNEN